MADSDSGTHISDITENNPEELEAKRQGHLESIGESTTTKAPKTIFKKENRNFKKKKEIIELKNVKNTTTLEERNIIPDSSPISQSTQNHTDASQTQTQTKHEAQPNAFQGHRAKRFNSQSLNGGSHVTTAHVHSAPREINGDLPAAPRRQARRQRSLPPKWPQTSSIGSRGLENMALDRSFESFHGNSSGGPRTAYDFMDAQTTSRSKRAAVIDVDMDDREESGDSDEVEEVDASWAPTGIFAVFVITLWTAVLKLIDSIDQNGPVICSEGEEVRLWICAGCLSLILCVAEITWKNKSLVKAFFGTILVFTYMMLGHTEPLSCRLGEEKLTEIGKWQAAMNFFFAALLGTRVYQEIAESIRQKRKKKKGRKERRMTRTEEESSDEGSSVMRVYRV